MFIDAGVQDGARLAEALARPARIEWLSQSDTPLEAIAAAVDGVRGLRGLHIITHGGPGFLDFSSGRVDVDTLRSSEEQLTRIRAALAPGAEITLYACAVADGDTAFAYLLARQTGASVIASTTSIGEGLSPDFRDFPPSRPFGGARQTQQIVPAEALSALPVSLGTFDFETGVTTAGSGTNRTINQTVDGVTLTVSHSGAGAVTTGKINGQSVTHDLNDDPASGSYTLTFSQAVTVSSFRIQEGEIENETASLIFTPNEGTAITVPDTAIPDNSDITINSSNYSDISTWTNVTSITISSNESNPDFAFDIFLDDIVATAAVGTATEATSTAAGFNTTDGTNLDPSFNFGDADETLTLGAANHLVGSTANGGGGADTLSAVTGADFTTATLVTGFETLALDSGASVTMTETQHDSFTTAITGDGNETITIGAGSGGDAALTGNANIEAYVLQTALTFTLGSAAQGVTGSSGADTVNIGTNTVTGTLNGGDGTDILVAGNGANLSGATISNFETLALASGALVTMTEQQHDAFTGITGAGTETILINSNNGDSTLTGNANVETYVLASSGTTFTLGAAGQSVNGSSSAETINIAGLTVTGSINAFGGTDILSASTGANISGGTVSNFKTLALASGASVTMSETQHDAFTNITSDGSETITIAANNGDAAITGNANVETYVLASSGTTFTLGSVGQSVTGGIGNETINALTGDLTGTLNGGGGTGDTLVLVNGSNISGATIGNIENLTLGSGASVTMTEEQRDGFNNITAAGAETVTITSDTGGDEALTAKANIETYILEKAMTFTLSRADQSVTAGSAADTISVGTLNVTGNISGGDGADILSAGDGANLSGATINGFETLTIADGGTVTMTAGQLNSFTTSVGGGGTETAVLTATGTITNANLSTLEGISTSSGGTEVITISAAAANGKTLTAVDTGTDAFNVTASDGAQTIAGSAGADTIGGGAGADSIGGGAGTDSLTGGSEADTFFGSVADLNGDTIADLAAGDSIFIDGVTTIDTNGAVGFQNNGTLRIDTDGTDFATTEVSMTLSNSPGALLEVASVTDSGSGTLITFQNETTAPTLDLDSSSPKDNAIEVRAGTSPKLKFSENIQGVAGQTITLVDVSNNATRETFTFTNATSGTGSSGGSVSVTNDEITIDPGADFAPGTVYAIQVGSASVTDIAGNAFAGISDNTTLNFTTRPTLKLSANTTSVREPGQSTATVTVTVVDGDGDPFTLPASAVVAVQLDFGDGTATITDDFTVANANNNTITIAGGTSSSTFEVHAVNDQTSDDNETIIVKIDSATTDVTVDNVQPLTLTIKENALPSFANLDGGSQYVIGSGSLVRLDGNVTVADLELDAANNSAGNYNGASVTIARQGGAVASDTFGVGGSGLERQGANILVSGTAVATVNTATAGQITITFTDAATSAIVDQVLQQITYRNDSATPSTATFEWTFNDGSEDSEGTNTSTVGLVNPSPPADDPAPDPAPAPAPTTPNTPDTPLVPVVTQPSVTPGGQTVATSTIQNTGTTRGSANIVENTGNNDNIVSASLPPATTITSEGPPTSQTPADAVTTLVTAVDARDSQSETELIGGAQEYLNTLAETTQLDVRTIVPTTTQTTLTEPIIITGTSPEDGSTQSEAFVIDLRSLPAGSNLQIENIEFASIMGEATITGGSGENYVTADDNNQFISLGEGNDTLSGGAGNDEVASGSGIDELYGGAGLDTVRGGTDTDFLFGGTEADLIYGNQGDDIAYGNQGNDTLFGGQDADIFYGGQDADLGYGNFGGDIAYGNRGDDIIYGNQGGDTLFGGQDSDTLFGGQEDDVLYGGDSGDGSDDLVGSLGNDSFHGGTGVNWIYTGEGEDRVFIESGGGINVVDDFDVFSGDRIVFASDVDGVSFSSFEDVLAQASDNEDGFTEIDVGNGLFVRLNGIATSQLTADFFEFG